MQPNNHPEKLNTCKQDRLKQSGGPDPDAILKTDPSNKKKY